jgi:hypothetical protein
MCRHPFFGIVIPQTVEANGAQPPRSVLDSAQTRRRTFFAQLAAFMGAGAALLVGRTSHGQQGQVTIPTNPPTTSGVQRVPSGGTYTTQALGEEGGGNYPPPGTPPPGSVTTYAIGEEGAGYPRPPSSPPPGTVTTQALGEEGAGGGTSRPRRYYRSPRFWYRY